MCETVEKQQSVYRANEITIDTHAITQHGKGNHFQFHVR